MPRPLLALVSAAVLVLTLGSDIARTEEGRIDLDDFALSPQQYALLEAVLAGDGFITEDLHAAFWTDLPEEMRAQADARAHLRAQLDATVVASLRFQRETWRSAEASREAGRVVKTSAFPKTRRKVEALIAATEPAEADGTPRPDNLARAEALLRAVATGTPLDLPTGPVRVSGDRIRSVLSGLEGSLYRMDRLLEPDFALPPLPQAFAETGLTVSWPQPFVLDIRRRPGADGRPRTTTTLTSRLDAREFAFITVIEFSGPWRDAEAGMRTLINSALASAAVTPENIKLTAWRDRLSAVGRGNGLTTLEQPGDADADAPAPDAVAHHAAVRVIHWPERRSTVTLLALSGASDEAALAIRGKLEEALELQP